MGAAVSGSLRTLGILPASGTATRMGGLPKFLLPVGPQARPLLDLHLEAVAGCVDEVVVAIHPKFAAVTQERVAAAGALLTVMETRTMSETVLNLVRRMGFDRYLIGLPDVFVTGWGGYAAALGLLDRAACGLAVWRSGPGQVGRLGNLDFDGDGRVLDIQDKVAGCPYAHHWGIAAFTRECLLAHTDPAHPHIGFTAETALRRGERVACAVVPGRYFDCGTPQEYLSAPL